MSTQTYSSLNAEQKTFYNRTLITRLVPNLMFIKYGQKRPFSGNEGDTVNFRRFNSLAPATTSLTEGVTPNGNSLDVTSVTATVQQYGDYITISDKLDMLGIDPVLTETAELLGEQAANTLDIIARDIISTGTSVQYAGGAANANTIAVSGKLSAAEIMKAVRSLRAANVKPMEGSYYIGFIDSYQAYDLMSDPLWQDVSKYTGGAAIMVGEVGKLGGVRFIETSNIKTYQNTAAVPLSLHCALIIGKDAYGVVDVEGGSKPQMIVKPHGSAGSSDPLNQRATAGWKALMTVKILQQLAIIRIETAVS